MVENPTDFQKPLVQADIDGLLQREPLRVRSLVVTLCGDCIAPNGGMFFLGALIRFLQPLGVSERAIRTAVFRLSKEGMFKTEREGRRSRYMLTRAARRQFSAAERRIYRAGHVKSGHVKYSSAQGLKEDVSWTLVLLPNDLSGPERDQIRKELGWQGFSSLSPTVLAHANPALDEAVASLKGMDMSDRAVVMSANVSSVTASTALSAMVGNAWPLDAIDARYGAFIDIYTPFAQRLDYLAKSGAVLDSEIAFRLRVLLVHDFRRALLRDPGLPLDLAPEGWRGEDARALFERIYRRIAPDAQDYVGMVLAEENGGEDSKVHDWYKERFTDLIDMDRPEDYRVVSYDVSVAPEIR